MLWTRTLATATHASLCLLMFAHAHACSAEERAVASEGRRVIVPEHGVLFCLPTKPQSGGSVGKKRPGASATHL